ncbi:hypothetical protein [Enterovibrio baiacu]|uniref:hypothetical protein n=1 Tax=Enterovibrio baiacu TaxID=2491023 RepID=UPI0010115BFB|nr:hypothetical protein [Enterovibrio baiacu]MBE1274495.1 hypothetical protein [Enterovibrio baiacu]
METLTVRRHNVTLLPMLLALLSDNAASEATLNAQTFNYKSKEIIERTYKDWGIRNAFGGYNLFSEDNL